MTASPIHVQTAALVQTVSTHILACVLKGTLARTAKQVNIILLHEISDESKLIIVVMFKDMSKQ